MFKKKQTPLNIKQNAVSGEVFDEEFNENLTEEEIAAKEEAYRAKQVADMYKHNAVAKRKLTAYKVFLYILMVAIAVVLLFPFFYMIMKSLMTLEEIEGRVPVFFPKVPQFKNYVTVFQTGGYAKGLLWTTVIIAFNLIVVPIAASIIAYSFAKLRWTGRNVMFALMLGSMMLPAAVTQLPLYVIYSKYFHWINSIWPFTIPNLFGGGAVYIFLIRQFMMGIPNELENAAKIDGANAFTRFSRIIFPLCKPVIIYVMVQVFIAYWGDYYGPLVYMPNRKKQTLAFVLYDFITDKSTGAKDHILMAGAVFMSVIPTIVFAIFQKQLIEGVTMSGLKG